MGTKQTIVDLDEENIRAARGYISKFWVNLQRYQPHDEDTLIGLPHPYLVPAHDATNSFNFDEMYYWDSYFMVQGMLRDLNSKELVLGILENLFTLLKRFKIIPNASRTYLMGRSQPPLLTTFIFDVYEAYALDRRWLEQAIAHAKTEYETVWMSDKKPHWHLVYEGLSRYYDINMLHDLAEAESGWDMTPRFDRRCLDFLPVDLNAYLYKYEADFARAAKILAKKEEQISWEQKAKVRADHMQKYMWNEQKNFFFDYDYKNKKQTKTMSLAGFMPLWAGCLEKRQANKLIDQLETFLFDGGLATTKPGRNVLLAHNTTPQQWAHPNGWAPLHFLVTQGLKNYGFEKQAENIALKWLKTNLDWFTAHNVFLEKYNVAEPAQAPADGVYPIQTGFGWTNAIFERFCQDYLDKK